MSYVVFVIACYDSVQQTKISNSLHLRFGTNLKIKKIKKKNVVSALKEIAIETYPHEEYASDSSASNSDDNDEDEFIPPGQQKKLEFYTQESLNDLIRDLGLPKDVAEH